MILVKSNPDLEARLQAMSDSQMKDSMAAMEVFNDELKKAGVLKDCDAVMGCKPALEPCHFSSSSPRPARMRGACFSTRALRVADCLAPAKCSR